MEKSPFAPRQFPELKPVKGFDMGVGQCGIKYKNRDDVWVLRGAPGTQIAGVFTKNAFPGAPVTWSRKALLAANEPDYPRILIVNSGNANVFTGDPGLKATELTANVAERVFGAQASSVMLASTGVIGEILDVSKIVRAMPDISQKMSDDLWETSARAIMTTDTYPKGATVRAEIAGAEVVINGIAKGSGMIAPDMATMLAFIVTDAKIEQSALQSILSEYTALTFNAITVDSDTSTSDMVLIAASGQADHAMISDPEDSALNGFKNALLKVMLSLSHQIIKDGEGASKFVTINIEGALSDDSARSVAMSIGNSPLVKTAIAGEDANWGRLIMAIGKSGEPVEPEKLCLWLGSHRLVRNGQLDKKYTEKAGAEYMKRDHLEIRVDLGLGSGCYTAWTCDFTRRYIDINADYRS